MTSGAGCPLAIMILYKPPSESSRHRPYLKLTHIYVDCLVLSIFSSTSGVSTPFASASTIRSRLHLASSASLTFAVIYNAVSLSALAIDVRLFRSISQRRDVEKCYGQINGRNAVSGHDPAPLSTRTCGGSLLPWSSRIRHPPESETGLAETESRRYNSSLALLAGFIAEALYYLTRALTDATYKAPVTG
jgi:hypothetical protein